jgi:hypothetical protein
MRSTIHLEGKKKKKTIIPPPKTSRDKMEHRGVAVAPEGARAKTIILRAN